MDLELNGKVAAVTGASRGIGRAIALRLAAEGMHVVAAARDADLLRTLVQDIESAGGRCLAFPADLRTPDAPAALVAAAIEQFGRLDAIVNNAGATRRGDFLELSEADWQDGFDLKFYAAVRTSRAAWGHLRQSGGTITNIAGVGGRTGSAEFTIGGAVNAAMLNLTKCLADRGVRDGVRVNAINPGSILTDRLTLRIRKLAADRSLPEAAAAAEMTEHAGLARFGEASEIADVVAFLASPRSAYINGAILDVDGGLTRTL